MVFLLKCLALQNPQPISPSKYVQNLHSNSAPPIHSYPEPPSSFGLSHCQNPNKSDPPIWILVPPRWPCQLSVTCCNYFGPTENCNRYHRDGLPTLCCLIASLRSYRVDAIGAIEMRIALSHCTSVHPSCSYRSHRDS